MLLECDNILHAALVLTFSSGQRGVMNINNFQTLSKRLCPTFLFSS